MRNYYFVVFLLVFVCATYAQSAENATFSTYWQQKVAYTMDIQMDVENYQYLGKQKLVYTNNSPDELHKVFYHLYFNAFQPNSEMDARLQNIQDPDYRMLTNVGTKENRVYKSKISQLQPEEIGFIKVLSLKQNDHDVSYEIEGTILEVRLHKPIKSGEQVVFDMEFKGQVPLMIRRSGRNNKGGVALSMAQWYPKMAVYDFEGWHADPYIQREFFGEWGDFDVKIKIDKNYMLGGTGYVQNLQEVGHGYEDTLLPLKTTDTETLTWHFKAPNVHDFAWVADRNFVHDIQNLANGKVLHFLYKDTKTNKKTWKKMQAVAVETMEFYNEYIGEYPYDQYSIIQGGDGGMEYAMCTMISGNRNFVSLVGTMMHEMAHAWFQFSLATNENKHAWMDEGFATFVEAVASDQIMNNKDAFIFEYPYNYYYYLLAAGKEEPLTTHSDRYHTNLSYEISTYNKGSVFLVQLGYVIGWEKLENTLKEYFKTWKGKHPSPNDFIRVAEQESGIELDWYLNEFTQTTHTIDYAIKDVAESKVTLERIGQMPMPIDIQVTYIDGNSENFYIPLTIMRGKKQTNATVLPDWNWGHPSYTFHTQKSIKEIIIDTSQLLADSNKENNTFSR